MPDEANPQPVTAMSELNILLKLFQRKNNKFRAFSPPKCLVSGETPDIETDDEILCCLSKTAARLNHR
jgi:hypothetical protein